MQTLERESLHKSYQPYNTGSHWQVNTSNLRNRALWACGWLQRSQLNSLDEMEFTSCKSCGSTGLAKGFIAL